jgi:hypothetical protein
MMDPDSIYVIGAYESRGAHSHKRPHERSPVEFRVGDIFWYGDSMGLGFFSGRFFDWVLGSISGVEGSIIQDQVYRIGFFEWSEGESVSGA